MRTATTVRSRSLVTAGLVLAFTTACAFGAQAAEVAPGESGATGWPSAAYDAPHWGETADITAPPPPGDGPGDADGPDTPAGPQSPGDQEAADGGAEPEVAPPSSAAEPAPAATAIPRPDTGAADSSAAEPSGPGQDHYATSLVGVAAVLLGGGWLAASVARRLRGQEQP